MLYKKIYYLTMGLFQTRKFADCACAGNAGSVSSPPRVSNPDMHHGTCVMHVPWCMPGSLSSGFPWGQWRGKRSRHLRCMRNPQFYVSGKRPMALRCLIVPGILSSLSKAIAYWLKEGTIIWTNEYSLRYSHHLFYSLVFTWVPETNIMQRLMISICSLSLKNKFADTYPWYDIRQIS